MYQSAEARPAPRQASKINFFVRIVNVFRLTLLSIFAKSIFCLWPVLTQAINSMFPNPWVEKGVLALSDM